MRHLKTSIHPDINHLDRKVIIQRKAARAIVVNGEEILLYTQRYHDYSIPGGGIDDGEDIIEGLVRELTEETGARNIHSIKPFLVFMKNFDHGTSQKPMLFTCIPIVIPAR